MFMKCQGTREERVRETLFRMGPAVLNGGLTTFLAIVFLGFSDSHIFITFFKVSEIYLIILVLLKIK